MARARVPRLKPFPERYWDPFFLGYVHLTDFFNTRWESQIRIPRPPDPRREIAAVQRARRRGEEMRATIESEDTSEGFLGAFMRRLMFSETSHPRTYEVLWVDIVTSYPVIMSLKAKYMQTRPAQLDPSLDPIIKTPGHPAYPSGHSTQGHLIALSLGAIVPGAARVLMRLADSIAKNREIAGVHYPSDSRAGVILARQIFDLMTTRPMYRRLLAAARSEW